MTDGGGQTQPGTNSKSQRTGWSSDTPAHIVFGGGSDDLSQVYAPPPRSGFPANAMGACRAVHRDRVPRSLIVQLSTEFMH